MSDFLLVVDYYFNVVMQLWSLISSNFILALCFLVGVFALIIYLYTAIKGTN